VGSQHLARQFARDGWTVHYFSAPVSPLHLPDLFRSEVLKRFKAAFQCQTIHENGMIRSYVPFSIVAPDGRSILRNKMVTHNWFRMMMPSFQALQKKMGLERISIVYIDNLSYHFLVDQLECEKSVFRVMDMHERFPGWMGNAFRLARKIARHVDLTAYSAHGLKNYVDTLGADKAAFMPNGVDFDFFHDQQPFTKRHPIIRSIPDPILLYAGMIDARLDIRLIRSAAKGLPNISFVFTGPVNNSDSLRDMPTNVYFTGPVPHDQLPTLMSEAKAGLIPFDVNNHMGSIQGIRPLKLLEYLAAGIPVISARWPEVEEMGSPAWLYENEGEFVALVHKVLHDDYDPTIGSSFARQHDWNHSFEMMLNGLKNI
jgi:glycosyltransferase involved in cell wall biosynthesis